jgi:ParB family transcriptional regulator, chromosome partitioning protein
MRKLGKGLSELGLTELLGGSHHSAAAVETHAYDKILHLQVDTLVPGQYQPRQYIDQVALAELADSIRAQGILQPLIVRLQSNQSYEIIAGERRWRAAQLAGLDKVPAIVREISDQTAIAFGLIENIQRRDLNALEEAQALQRLLEEFNLTHDAVAQAVGKSRASISNLLRLLQLNADVKQLLAEGRLEMGHARALLGLDGPAQSECAQRAVAQQLSVRETEALVRRQSLIATPAQEPAPHDHYALQSQQNLTEKLGAKVAVRHNQRGKGKIVIHYSNFDELTGILNHIH